jgi:hypothetical protein
MFLPIDCTTLGCGEKAVRWAPFCTGCGKPLVAPRGTTGALSPERELQLSPAGSVHIAPGPSWKASPIAGSLVVVSKDGPTIVQPTSDSIITSRTSQACRGSARAEIAFSRPWFAVRDENADGSDVLMIGSGALLQQDLASPPPREQPTVTVPLRRCSGRPSATGRLSTLASSTLGFFALEDAEGAVDHTTLRHFVVRASTRAPWVPEWSEPSPALRLPGRGWVIDHVGLSSPDRIGLIRPSGAVAIVAVTSGTLAILRIKILEGSKGEVVGMAHSGGDDVVCHLLHQGRSTLVSVAGNGDERTISTQTNAGLLSIAPTIRHNSPVVGARFDDSLVAVRPLELDLTQNLRMVPKLSRVQGLGSDGLVAIDQHQRVWVESNYGFGMLRGGAPATVENVAFARLDWPHLWLINDLGHGRYSVARYLAHEKAQ